MNARARRLQKAAGAVAVLVMATGCHSLSGGPTTAIPGTTGSPTNQAPVASSSSTASTGGGSLVGSWESSDGTPNKVFRDNGSCKGFFYNAGKPLDIGGPMECVLASKTDSSGRYKLVVTQGPNKSSYLVQFSGDDAATVYTTKGAELYRLTRF